MFREMKVPLAYTWEIYGDLKADSNDCFRMFNPISKEQFEVCQVEFVYELHQPKCVCMQHMSGFA